MKRMRRFRWNSILDTLIFLTLLAVINQIWFRQDPAFRSEIMHPYLIPITLIGLFYGFREGLASVLMVNVFYSSQLVLAGYAWTAIGVQPDLRNVITFLLAGLCFGEAGELYRRTIEYLRQKEASLEASLAKTTMERDVLTLANTELEDWIRFGDVHLTEIHAVSNELFSFDEARILDVIAPLSHKIIGSDQCALYLLDRTNQTFWRHSQAGRNGVTNPHSVSLETTPFKEMKSKPRIFSAKDVTPADGVHFLIAVPILIQGTLQGVLLVESMPLIRLTAYTLANLGFLSDLVNRCLDNAAVLQSEGEGPKAQTLFRERLQQEVHLTNRTNSDLSLLYLNVENFKTYKDELGPETTKTLINQIMRAITKMKRRSDVLSYQGNGRFALLLPQTAPEKTNAFVERTRDEINLIKIPSREGKIDISYSLGTNALVESGLKGGPEAIAPPPDVSQN